MLQVPTSRIICSAIKAHSLNLIPLSSGQHPILNEGQFQRSGCGNETNSNQPTGWSALPVISLLPLSCALAVHVYALLLHVHAFLLTPVFSPGPDPLTLNAAQYLSFSFSWQELLSVHSLLLLA